MQIIIEKTGQTIPFSKMGIATFRTDLTPVPLHLEMALMLDDELEGLIIDGAILLVGNDQIPVEIVKVSKANTQMIVTDKRVKIASVIAILSGCETLIDPLNKAVILNGTTFAQAYRACGAKIRFNKDIPLSKFISAYGSMPTIEIATCLQEESAVIFYKNGKLNAQRLLTLFTQDPVMKLDNSAVSWIKNTKVEQRQVPTFVSVGGDGAVVSGNQKANTPTKYYPDADARQLKNLNTILVTRGTATRTMDMTICAGDIFLIDDDKYIVLTAVHHFKTGALGGATASVSRFWLATVSS